MTKTLKSLAHAYSNVSITLNAAAKKLPKYAGELTQLGEDYTEISRKVLAQEADGLSDIYERIGEQSRILSNHHFEDKNSEKLRILRADVTATFYELTTLLKDVRHYVPSAGKFDELGDKNAELKKHVIASLTPNKNKENGLILQNLKVVKMSKKELKSLLI